MNNAFEKPKTDCVMTLSEFADFVRLSRVHVRKLIRDGHIDFAFKAGPYRNSHLRFYRTDAVAWLERAKTPKE